MTKKSEKKATTDRQKVFALSSDPPTRQRLSREQKPAYDAGMIDAYLNILKKVGSKEPINWEKLIFTEPQARKLCFMAIDSILSERRKLRIQVNVQKRLLGEIQQTHLDF
jgi:hypothetical protein